MRGAVRVHALDADAVAPQAGEMAQHFRRRFAERPAVVHVVAQRQRAVAEYVDLVGLDVGLAVAQVVLVGKQLAHGAIAGVS